MAMDARSKITIHPADAARLGLQLVDRLYGPPTLKQNKVGNASFQLEFAWATPVMPQAQEETAE
jgi:hypothetical protein